MDGVSRATINTLGGKTAENRGRRGDTPPSHEFNPDSPFEDGQLSDNWGKRQGWDKYFNKQRTDRPQEYPRDSEGEPMNKSNDPYDRSVRSLNDSENYEFSGESEYSRERSDPYQMVDYMIDRGVDFREKDSQKLTVADEKIREEVCEILARDSRIDATEVEVEVKEGVVYLIGQVDGRPTKRLAELMIENLPGVSEIINHLHFDFDHPNTGAQDL